MPISRSSLVAMKPKTLPLALLLSLGTPLLCFAQQSGDTRIIGKIYTGEVTKSSSTETATSPDFEVLESKVHNLNGRRVTVQKVNPPQPVAVEPRPVVATQDNTEVSHVASSGLIFMTALPAKSGGYDLQIVHNGKSVKAWTNIEARYLSGFHEFMANGRHYHIMLLSVAGNAALDQARRTSTQQQSVNYFLTEHQGDEQASRTLLKDLHDLYEVEWRNLQSAYEERMRNQAIKEAELAANPPQPKDVTIRFWKRDVQAERAQKELQK